jgi:hypothetical protein
VNHSCFLSVFGVLDARWYGKSSWGTLQEINISTGNKTQHGYNYRNSVLLLHNFASDLGVTFVRFQSS